MGKTRTSGSLQMLSVKIPRALSARVARIARRRRTTVSDVVRAALEALEDAELVPRQGSALARAGALVGSVAGPGDLSTNPRHLDGFGE